ncbi:hypothetical protein DRH27_01215 [Candidatus Falkowbacteria bacterium]|nr:MAG: hypothetical protein DRH27_01215 [Candidatus Falkowbacteria bacterium]
MNKILQLFDEKYVVGLLTEKVLPLYPGFSGVRSVKIRAYKKMIWEHTYHVVIEFKTSFLSKNGKVVQIPIFCSAHSEEPRKNVYDSLKFLWEHGFGKGKLSIPHPLFYSDYFKGTFYRGVEGRNLYRFIREDNRKEVESIVLKAAAWFAKLHSIDTKEAHNFNKENSRIETVFPGIKHILWRIGEDYPQYGGVYKKIYKIVNKREKDFLVSTSKRWLVHGDAHPENIIKMSPRKIAVIDFTDLCLSDFARDIGAFTQQLEFMINRKISGKEYAEKVKKIFINNYFKNSKIKLNSEIQARIDNYYYWTAMRTATYFLIKDKPEPERSHPVILKVCQEMDIENK